MHPMVRPMQRLFVRKPSEPVDVVPSPQSMVAEYVASTTPVLTPEMLNTASGVPLGTTAFRWVTEVLVVVVWVIDLAVTCTTLLIVFHEVLSIVIFSL